MDSFALLYERYFAPMVGVAYSVMADRHLAEDAAQETFAIAAGDLAALKCPEKFAPWLRGICRNVAKGMLRAGARRTTAEESSSQPTVGADDPRNQLVREAVMQLPPTGREVVLLHYFSGLEHKQIAAVLGISPQAVHGRLVRARRKIAARLTSQAMSGIEL